MLPLAAYYFLEAKNSRGQPADSVARFHLDTIARSLLQVKVKEVDAADDIFTKLMGDIVEPRREFIQDNSLAANVDV